MAANRPFKFTVVGDAAAATGLRAELRTWLHAAAVNEVTGYAITSSVSEAFVNAVEHPVDRAGEDVLVEGVISGGEVVVRVRDQGRWNESVDPARDHYGFRLMEAQMDSVEVERGVAGTVVTLRRTI